jgi:hypothetical protein
VAQCNANDADTAVAMHGQHNTADGAAAAKSCAKVLVSANTDAATASKVA